MIIDGRVVVLLACIIFPLTLVITYPLSVYNNHVHPIWPFISHTGDLPIESCFFSLGLNSVAGCYCFLVCLRYRQVKDHLSYRPNKYHSLVNRSSLAWGVIASFTLSMTSSFQQTNAGPIHLLSAITCSYTALFYFWHQTFLSYKYANIWMKRKTYIFRFILSTTSTILHIVAPGIYFYMALNHPKTSTEMRTWTPKQEGYAIHLTGSIMEWFVLLLNELYIGTFYSEFKEIHFMLGEIIFGNSVIT